MHHLSTTSRGSGLVVAALALAIAGGLLSAAWPWVTGRPLPRPASTPALLLDQPGVDVPPATPADTARVHDDAAVIGVTAGGKTRAYVVAAFGPGPGGQLATHVVNDYLGGVAVTVTHCDRTGCTRVLTDAAASGPLAVGVGGWLGGRAGGLLLRVGGRRFRQDTGRALAGDEVLPHADLPFTRTTWKQWRQQHPTTDVYTRPAGGDGPAANG